MEPLLEMSPAASLRDEAGIIGSLVLVPNLGKQVSSPAIGLPLTVRELVRECEKEYDERLLVFRLDLENVQTDALRLLGFVQEAVLFCPFESPE